MRSREGVAARAAASQPAGDGLRRYDSGGSRARHVEPVVVAGAKMDDDEAFELLGLASHLMRKLDEASQTYPGESIPEQLSYQKIRKDGVVARGGRLTMLRFGQTWSER